MSMLISVHGPVLQTMMARMTMMKTMMMVMMMMMMMTTMTTTMTIVPQEEMVTFACQDREMS